MKYQPHLVVVFLCCSVQMPVASRVALAQAPDPGPDRSTPALGLKVLLDAIDRGDTTEVSRSIAFPNVELTPAEQIALADRLMAGTLLARELERKFDADTATRALRGGRLAFVPDVQPDKLAWRVTTTSARPGNPPRDIAIAKAADGRPVALRMTRIGDAEWKWEAGDLPVLVLLEVADAPWQASLAHRVVADIRGGKLTSKEEAVVSLIPRVPPGPRPAADRSTPEGAVAALLDAIERGDVAGASDAIVRAREPGPAFGRWVAEDLVTARRLEKAIRARFEPGQADRILKEGGVGVRWLDRYRRAAWAVDGDTARAAFDPPTFYDASMRMVRAGGAWRIEMPPRDPAADVRRRPGEQTDDERLRSKGVRQRRVLAALDEYQTAGAVLEALDPSRTADQGVASLKARADELAEMIRNEQAQRPPGNPNEAAQRAIGQTILKLGVAVIGKRADEAAECYFAQGDDDAAYVNARQRRVLATHDLISAANREIGSVVEQIAREFELINLADDAMGLAMADWEIDADQAGAKAEGGGPDGTPFPRMRKVGSVWKIDVSSEINGRPKDAASRADAETASLAAIARRIRDGKLTTADALRGALIDEGIKRVGKAK